MLYLHDNITYLFFFEKGFRQISFIWKALKYRTPETVVLEAYSVNANDNFRGGETADRRTHAFGDQHSSLSKAGGGPH